MKTKRLAMYVAVIAFASFIFGSMYVYNVAAYSSQANSLETFASIYAYAYRTIRFNATRIGASCVETITLSTKAPMSTSAETQLSAKSGTYNFIEYGANEDMRQVFGDFYNNLFKAYPGDRYFVDYSNASTYILDHYGNGTQQWYNMSNHVNDFAPFSQGMVGTGQAYSCVLSSPRTLMSYYCQQYGYLNPVLIENNVSVQSVWQPYNVLGGKTIDFIAIAESEPMNISNPVGDVSVQAIGAGTILGIVAIAAAVVTIITAIGIAEFCSFVTTGEEFFTHIFNEVFTDPNGNSGSPFPENHTFTFEMDPVAQQVMGEAWTAYQNGTLPWSEFSSMWDRYMNATSVPASLSLGYEYADMSASKGEDIFTTITVFVRNIISVVLSIIMIGIIIFVVVLIIKFSRKVM